MAGGATVEEAAAYLTAGAAAEDFPCVRRDGQEGEGMQLVGRVADLARQVGALAVQEVRAGAAGVDAILGEALFVAAAATGVFFLGVVVHLGEMQRVGCGHG